MAELVNMTIRERLHAELRRRLALVREDGCEIDKRLCRFNDMVEAAIRYGRCSDPFSESAALAGLQEAIDCCIVGDPMHYRGGSCLGLVGDWMLASADPCEVV